MMVVYIAGIQNVPSELQDAAKVDGAGAWQTLKNVTIPDGVISIGNRALCF